MSDRTRATGDATARPDAHNAEVDEDAAGRGLCRVTHLNSGHVCLQPERHRGGCVFEAPA